jgi:hypothetical protein
MAEGGGGECSHLGMLGEKERSWQLVSTLAAPQPSILLVMNQLSVRIAHGYLRQNNDLTQLREGIPNRSATGKYGKTGRLLAAAFEPSTDVKICQLP